jgi:hypothetical protein
MNNIPAKQTLSPREIAQSYGIPEGTLANMRWQKQGPKYYRVGRRILYKVVDVEGWLFSHPVLTIGS